MQCPCKNCLVFPICKARSNALKMASIYLFCEDVIKCKDAVDYITNDEPVVKEIQIRVNIIRRLFGMTEI